MSHKLTTLPERNKNRIEKLSIVANENRFGWLLSIIITLAISLIFYIYIQNTRTQDMRTCETMLYESLYGQEDPLKTIEEEQ